MLATQWMRFSFLPCSHGWKGWSDNWKNEPEEQKKKRQKGLFYYSTSAHICSASTMFKNAAEIIYSGTKKKKKTEIQAVFDYKYLDQ